MCFIKKEGVWKIKEYTRKAKRIIDAIIEWEEASGSPNIYGSFLLLLLFLVFFIILVAVS